MKTSLFIDAEWYINQRIFLIGYAYDTGRCRHLYGKNLTRIQFKQLLKKVTAYIFAYGPDIGMCEKHFRWKFREKYICINLMKVFRDHLKTGSFKLKDLEVRFGIKRKVSKYKTSIFHIWRDWRNPRLKMMVLQYNLEDVINLIKITKKIFKKFRITKTYLHSVKLS
jgi:uncharacterized protein YprB with RNaseH-like and TPR domain